MSTSTDTHSSERATNVTEQDFAQRPPDREKDRGKKLWWVIGLLVVSLLGFMVWWLFAFVVQLPVEEEVPNQNQIEAVPVEEAQPTAEELPVDEAPPEKPATPPGEYKR